MSQYREQAGEIRALLRLDSPPVALAFVDEVPPSIPPTNHVSPSACGFWRLAEQSVFYAGAEQHYNCQVGSMVMGFNLPPEILEQIGGLVETMAGCNYLDPAEAAKIPTMSSSSAGILYGPLADLPVTPTAVLLWLTPAQAMVYNEAAGAASWVSEPVRIGGRPGCAAIPLAIHGGGPSLSFGCAGMRTFTEIADDRVLAALPGNKLDEFVQSLRTVGSANEAMLSYYAQRKAETVGG